MGSKKIEKEKKSETNDSALEHVVPHISFVERTKSILIEGIMNLETDLSAKVCDCWITLFFFKRQLMNCNTK